MRRPIKRTLSRDDDGVMNSEGLFRGDDSVLIGVIPGQQPFLEVIRPSGRGGGQLVAGNRPVAVEVKAGRRRMIVPPSESREFIGRDGAVSIQMELRNSSNCSRSVAPRRK